MTDNGYVSGYANSSNNGNSIQVVKGSFIMFIHGTSSIASSRYITTNTGLTYAQLTSGSTLSTRQVSGLGYMNVVIASDDIRLILQSGSG